MNTYPVRTAAKAIIIENNQILVVKHRKNNEEFYTLPGGGQDHEEALEDTLKRECLEEAGAEIEIEDVAFVRDYIAANHEFAHVDGGFHQLEVMFLCRLTNSGSLNSQTRPDDFQIGIEWLPLDDILDYPLYPKDMRDKIKHINLSRLSKVYLGDIN